MFLQYPVDIINIRQECNKKHHGLDLGWDSNYKGSKNQEIKSIADGIVIYNRKQVSGGYVIQIYHPKYDLTSEYGHLLKNSQQVHEGDTVKKGETIAKMGCSGFCSGNHVHVGLQKGRGINYKNGIWIDPLLYLVRYKHQAVSTKSKDKLKIVDTRIVHGVESEPLLVHNKRNFLRSSIVKNLGFKNGDEMPCYEIDKYFVLCDKMLGYYSASKYIK